MKRYLFHSALVCPLLVLLTACGAPVAPTTLVAKASPSAGLAPTSTPAQPPASVGTLPPSSMPTAGSYLPTPPSATLTADEVKGAVSRLLWSNAGCLLPCWWGIVPGETPWQEVQSLFQSWGELPVQSSTSPVTSYDIQFTIPESTTQMYQSYNVSADRVDMIWVSALPLSNQGELFGDPQFLQTWQRYTLPQLLTTDGAPAQVLLRTSSAGPTGTWIPYHLVLFYPQRGMMVRYLGPVEINGGMIRACPQRSEITLWLWSPTRSLTLQDVSGFDHEFPADQIETFLSLQEATGLTIDQFVQSFSQPDNQLCLETPIQLWPMGVGQ